MTDFEERFEYYYYNHIYQEALDRMLSDENVCVISYQKTGKGFYGAQYKVAYAKLIRRIYEEIVIKTNNLFEAQTEIYNLKGIVSDIRPSPLKDYKYEIYIRKTKGERQLPINLEMLGFEDGETENSFN